MLNFHEDHDDRRFRKEWLASSFTHDAQEHATLKRNKACKG